MVFVVDQHATQRALGNRSNRLDCLDDNAEQNAPARKHSAALMPSFRQAKINRRALRLPCFYSRVLSEAILHRQGGVVTISQLPFDRVRLAEEADVVECHFQVAQVLEGSANTEAAIPLYP